MAPPPTIYQRCEVFYATLIREGRVGERIPRAIWDSAWVKWTKLSLPQVRKYTDTGAAAGFWSVISGHGPGNAGYVVPFAPRPTAVAIPLSAPPAA
jgi:hypothetical protein